MPSLTPSSTSQEATNARSQRTIVLSVGLMLFSMFFGAGNLIFPPMVGAQAGDSYLPAIGGFIITAVFFPAVTVIAVAVSGSGVRDLASRAGVVFGIGFSVITYLSIGAFYVIPRAATIGYELGIESTFSLEGGWWRLTCTGVFFAITFALALQPGKVADNLGKILTPILLILLVMLIIFAITQLNNPGEAPTSDFTQSPFLKGISEGYFTMDSLAALAFAIIVISSFGVRGFTDHKQVVRMTATSACLAGGALLFVYLGLGYIGVILPNNSEYSDGAKLLSDAALLTMGTPGEAVFSLVVLLACLTTAVGLVAATSSFFHELLPRVSYRAWAIVFTLTALGISNLGLETLLSIAEPIIGLIYPPAIALITVSLLHLLVPNLRLPNTYRAAVYTALAFSLLALVVELVPGVTALGEVLAAYLPLFSANLGWLLPTALAATIAVAADISIGRTRKEPLVSGEIDESLQTTPSEGPTDSNQ